MSQEYVSTAMLQTRHFYDLISVNQFAMTEYDYTP